MDVLMVLGFCTIRKIINLCIMKDNLKVNLKDMGKWSIIVDNGSILGILVKVKLTVKDRSSIKNKALNFKENGNNQSRILAL